MITGETLADESSAARSIKAAVAILVSMMRDALHVRSTPEER